MKKIYLMLLVILLSVSFLFASRIYVVKSSGIALYDEAIHGFRETMAMSGQDISIEIMDMMGDEAVARDVIQNLKSKRDITAIFTLGARASEMVSEEFTDVPVIFAYVLNWKSYPSLHNENVTGIEFEIAPNVSLALFSMVAPTAKRMGLIYDPENSSEVVETIEEMASVAGFEVITEKVSRSREVSGRRGAFNKLLEQDIEALWMIADPTVLTRRNLRYLIAESNNNNIPTLTVQDFFVESGALFAIVPDYGTIGSQAFNIAQNIINGQHPRDITVEAPMGSNNIINNATAEKLGLTFDDFLTRMFNEQYETITEISIAGAELVGGDRYAAEESFFAMQEVMVVSASRRAQRISDAPVSISVVSRADIEDMGVQSIPEALRMVPGVFVQQTLGGQYEVALRGTSNLPGQMGPISVYSRNILVLIDGRSFFNDMFGGTLWEFLPLTINDIERIEVVRGPASALFGANAATGVINIITRSSATIDEQVITASSSVGPSGRHRHSLYYAENFENMFVSFSYERNQKPRFNYEEYDPSKKTFVSGRGDLIDSNYPPADENSLESDKLVFSFNYEFNDDNSIDIKAGRTFGYQNFMGHSGDLLINKSYMEQEYAKITYQRLFADNILKLTYSKLNMLVGEDDTLNNPPPGFQNGVGLYSDDFELEGVFSITDNSVLVAGLNARFLESKSQRVFFRDRDDVKQNFKAFYINYDYAIIPDVLRVIPAVRIDKYDIPDITEASPQLSVFYRHNDNHTFKFIYSEAIRASFLTDIYVVALNTPGALTPLHQFLGVKEINVDRNFIEWRGYEDLDVPRVKSLELSYLTNPTPISSLEVSLFTHTMDDLIGFDFTPGIPYPQRDRGVSSEPSVSLNFTNLTEDYTTYGLELSYRMLLFEKWNFWSNYTYQSMKFGDNKIDLTPAHLLNMGVTTNLTDKLRLSASINYASEVESLKTHILDRNLEIMGPPALIPEEVTKSTLNNFLITVTDTSYLDLLTLQGKGIFETLKYYADTAQYNAKHRIKETAEKYEMLAGDLFLAIIENDTVAIGNLTNDLSYGSVDDATVLSGVASGMLVSELLKNAAGNVHTEKADAYFLLNLNLSYAVSDYTQLSFSAINLLDNKHKQNPYGEKIGASYLATLRFNF